MGDVRSWYPRFEPLTIAEWRMWASDRARGVAEVWRESGCVNVERFVNRHFDPVVSYGERMDRKPLREKGETVVTGHGLSFADCEGDFARLVLIDACGRTLLVESNCLRGMLRQELNPVSLVFWREATTPEKIPELEGRVAGEAMSLLLAEIERLTILRVFDANEVDLGKFF